MNFRWIMSLVVGAATVGGCASNEPAADVVADSVVVTTSTFPPVVVSDSVVVATSSTFPPVVVPDDTLVVFPTQNREDPAKQQFQVKVRNATDERLEVVGVQFVWDGMSSPETTRDSTIVGGQSIDFPLPIGDVECVGDGGVDEMPDIAGAVVLLEIDDGSVRRVPVFDKWNVARRLYLEACERRAIESLVGIEWVDLHEAEHDGRPVTAGALRVTRRQAVGRVVISSVSNTIPFVFEAVDSSIDEPVAVLAPDAEVIEVPIRFLESRCDPHALAEIKQPFKFISQVEIDGAEPRPFIIVPSEAAWIPMRTTADEACLVTGKIVFAGDEAAVGSTP